MSPSPRMYGVPHDVWRPDQYETVRDLINGFRRNNKIRIIQAPTGSGKSAIAAALSRNGSKSVRAVTHSLNLQKQYEDGYDFDPIYGMRHYPCEMWGNAQNASMCLYPEAMFNCPAKEVCEYLIQRNHVRMSNRQVFSYAYLLATVWAWDATTDYIAFDEGHLLPDITKNACTVEYTPEEVYHWDVEPYPLTNIGSMPIRVKIAVKWLRKVLLAQTQEYNRLMMIPVPTRKKNPGLGKKISILSREIMVLRRTIDHADNYPTDFYCAWDETKFKLVPLTARLYFKSLFIRGAEHHPIIMSATIGNPETFARELGLGDMWEFIDVPSAFPPASMPVYTFDDAPALGYKTSPAGWKHWGNLISKTVKNLDPSWSGIIHVASRKQASDLAEMLSGNGLEDRVYIPEGRTTRNKIKSWNTRKKKIPNTLAISWAFWMGLDAPDDEINIIGKVPFATLDDVGRAKLNYDRAMYSRDAALNVEQAAGRIRRGREEHYEVVGKPMRKFVAVADNRYGMIRSEFSSHFKNCLTTY